MAVAASKMASFPSRSFPVPITPLLTDSCPRTTREAGNPATPPQRRHIYRGASQPRGGNHASGARLRLVSTQASSDGPGWRWESTALKVDEESPPAVIRLIRCLSDRRPLFIREWLVEQDPGLNQSLISSGTTISQLFNQDKWENHRSVNRYLRDMQAWPKSTVLRRIQKPCLLVSMMGLLVCLWNTHAAPVVSSKLGLVAGSLIAAYSSIPHTMLGAAISLLLVFRTNSCHARFSEGRKLWGRAVANARKWSLLCTNYLPPTQHPRAARFIKVWSAVLKSHLRSGRTREDKTDPTAYKDDPSDYVRSEMPDQEGAIVLGSRNRPLTMLSLMTALVAEATMTEKPINITTQANLQACIDECGEVAGGCERLLSTPLPLSYSRHTSRSLFLWLLTMPLVLYSSCGFLMIPALYLMTAVLIGIDELASQIEEPFSILPLTPLTNVIIRETDTLFGLTSQLSDDAIGATAFEARYSIDEDDEIQGIGLRF